MFEVIRHLVWFFVVACATAYGFFLVAGGIIAQEAEASTRTVVVRDALSPGAHHLSGMVTVESTCAELVMRTEEHGNFTYELAFTTWEDPSVTCEDESIPRAFRAVLFAPATGVQIIGTLNGEPLALVILPVIPRD